jgi:hypothetical protein
MKTIDTTEVFDEWFGSLKDNEVDPEFGTGVEVGHCPKKWVTND